MNSVLEERVEDAYESYGRQLICGSGIGESSLGYGHKFNSH